MRIRIKNLSNNEETNLPVFNIFQFNDTKDRNEKEGYDWTKMWEQERNLLGIYIS